MRQGDRGRTERAIAWLIGVPFATWRYMSREVEIHRDESTCAWPIEGFPHDAPSRTRDLEALQRPSAGSGAAFHRRYRVLIERPLLKAPELMAIVKNDPNVACPLEIAHFDRDGTGPIGLGEKMVVRLPGPWNGPVRVVDVTARSFRLATARGHMEAGEIEFRARAGDETGLAFEIESWARSGDPLFDLLYARLRIAEELQLDMWAFFLERVAQISGGVASRGIELYTRRCDAHPL